MLKSRRLWLLVLGFAALHSALAMWLPLVEDEAYYQLWASVPSAGYYDHPPMVAWGIAAGQSIFGKGLLGVRVASILAAALVSLLVYRMAWLISHDPDVAYRAALWGKAMLPFSILAFAATPDAGSVLFWTAATWALVELLQSKNRYWWLAVGLFAGLGVLAKFTNLFFGLALVIWLIASHDGRKWLGVWQVWAGALLGLVVLLPFALWNKTNGFVGLERQFGRIGEDAGYSLIGTVEFWLAFLFLVTPLVFWLVLRSLRFKLAPGFLVWLIAPLLIFLTFQSTKTFAGGQWLVPIFPTLAVMAALAGAKGWVARWAAPSGFALAGLILVLGLWPGKPLLGNHLFSQMRGWERAGHEILSLVAENDVKWIATDAFGLTAQLNHYLGDDLPILSVIQPERYLFLATAPQELCSQKALFISRTNFPTGVPYFQIRQPQSDIIRKEGSRHIMRYYVAVVQGPSAGFPYFCH
jgi:4-amino-4-deoxy-L-arabinose transferase-like glycosyltransferase